MRLTRLDDVENGVRVDDHHEFIEWMATNPEDAMLSFRAVGAGEGTVNRTTATIGEWGLGGEERGEDREYTLEFGLPAELEESMGYTDPEGRHEATEVALASLAACINGTVQYNAIRDGIEVDEVETRVRVPTDLRVLFGIHDSDRADEMYGEPEIEVRVEGEDLTEDDAEKLRAYPQRSPVYNLLTLANPASPHAEVSGEGPESTTADSR